MYLRGLKTILWLGDGKVMVGRLKVMFKSKDHVHGCNTLGTYVQVIKI